MSLSAHILRNCLTEAVGQLEIPHTVFVTLVTLLFPFLVSISFIYYLIYVNN
jgi:hypothetical protein